MIKADSAVDNLLPLFFTDIQYELNFKQYYCQSKIDYIFKVLSNSKKVNPDFNA